MRGSLILTPLADTRVQYGIGRALSNPKNKFIQIFLV
jgi:hypothetical protein